MKIKYILVLSFAAILVSGMTSCSKDFLDENLINQKSTDNYKTQDGIDELVTGAYQKLKFKYNYGSSEKWSDR